MGELSEVINEIKRHKGVLLDDEIELVDFSKQLFYGAVAQMGLRQHDVDHLVESFVINKYKQVLTATIQYYHAQPKAREFTFRPAWKQLPELQTKLANEYMRNLK